MSEPKIIHRRISMDFEGLMKETAQSLVSQYPDEEFHGYKHLIDVSNKRIEFEIYTMEGAKS